MCGGWSLLTTEEASERLSSAFKSLTKLKQLKFKSRAQQSVCIWRQVLVKSLFFGLDCVLGLRANCKRTGLCVHFSPDSQAQKTQ